MKKENIQNIQLCKPDLTHLGGCNVKTHGPPGTAVN